MVDVDLNLVNAALHKTVDVQVLRGDIDSTECEHQRLVSIETIGKCAAVAIGDQGGIGEHAPGRVTAAAHDQIPRRGVVDVLPGVLVGMQPRIRAEREVASGEDVDVLTASFAGDIHASFEVGDVDVTVFVDDVADDVEVLIEREELVDDRCL